MSDEEIKNKAKETSGGNYYYEQGFIYGFELGEESGRDELREDFQQGKVTCAGMTIQEIINMKEENAELKAHCKAVDEVNVKLRNCFNCKNNSSKTSVFCRFYVSCKNNEYWQLAEKE